jgi:hypothetical protein
MPLLNFPPRLSYPRKELHTMLPPNHTSLALVLGHTLSYLEAIHQTTSSPSDENAWASGHILQLFIQDLLVQSLLENTVVNLARAQALSKAQALAAKETSA